MGDIKLTSKDKTRPIVVNLPWSYKHQLFLVLKVRKNLHFFFTKKTQKNAVF